jgi:hypothetical protein
MIFFIFSVLCKTSKKTAKKVGVTFSKMDIFKNVQFSKPTKDFFTKKSF